MIREVVLDTETTGVDAANGDRVIEIGCVELLNHIQTGKSWHAYINPQRAVSEGAYRVHGLSDAFLSDKPVFADVVAGFIDFIAGDTLVIHNAAFDIGFLNAELGRVGRPALSTERVLDTLALARRRHPNAPNSLDALCARFGIDNARRTKHGALLDSEILADVYIELIGGRQGNLGLALNGDDGDDGSIGLAAAAAQRPAPIERWLTDAEREAHLAFIAGMGESAIWQTYIRPAA